MGPTTYPQGIWKTGVCSHFAALVDALDAGLFIKGHGSLLLDRKSVELNVPRRGLIIN